MSTPMKWIAIPAKKRWHDRIKPIFDDGLWDILPVDNMEQLPICTVDRGEDHDEPTRAKAETYACLIAAAPELLHALKVAHATIDALTKIHDPAYEIYMRNAPEVKMVEAAIAKAEGR